MKAVLFLTVVLSGVLAVTAAAVEAVEAVPEKQELPEQTQGELPEQTQVVENEAAVVVPEVEEPELFSAVEVPPFGGRFYTCPAGWDRYKSSCYLYVSTGRSWSSALANCHSMGATLGSAHDLFEYTFLQQLTNRAGSSVAWMGGFYFQGWRWVDQTPFNYNFWNAQHSASSYPCIHVNARAGWSNNNCGNGWPSICVKSTNTC